LHNEFDRSVSDPRASSGFGESRKPLTASSHYAIFESEINKPNRLLIPKLWCTFRNLAGGRIFPEKTRACS
jgi:hypothetical protein